jgi:ligand-binding sensor domain-containing protein/signal transduction histidine kinase
MEKYTILYAEKGFTISTKNSMRLFKPLMRKPCIALLLFLFAVVPVAGTAQADEAGSTSLPPHTPLRFTSLSLEQGLSQSVVNVIYQDSAGYLWFGTQDGLNRYDGYHFTIFRPDPDNPTSLSDRYILSIIEDSDGGLWIGTVTGGLNRYDQTTGLFTHYTHDPKNPNSLGGDCIRTLFIDSDGLLWIGSDGGVDVFNPQQEVFLAHYRHNPADLTSLPTNSINHIYQDRSGVIWIASERGLSYQEGWNGAFIHLKHNPDDPTSLIANLVDNITEDSEGDLWLGTELGLERLDRQTLRFEHFISDSQTQGSLSNSNVSAILEDRNGYLWVGTAAGLNLLDRQRGTFTKYAPMPGDSTSLNNPLILSLYEDREGILWIGTFGGGVSKLDWGSNQFPILQYDLKNPKDISSFGLIEDHRGQLWFAMYGEGLLRLDRETGEYVLYQHNPADPENSLLDNYVLTVSESRDGTLWIGSRMGLNAFDPATGVFTHYTQNPDDPAGPTSLNGRLVGLTLVDSQGFLWITFPTGLDRFDRSAGVFAHYKHDPQDPTSLSDPYVGYVFEDQDGEIWLGMYEAGLSKLDRDTGRFTHYRHDPDDSETLSSDSVMMVMQDHTGAMWVGTGGGLNKFDPQTGKAIRYTVKDGLPNDVIYAIVEDDQGYLWLSTNYGLSRFDPTSGSFQNFDYQDGLQSNEFNAFAFAKTRAGEIIFAGIAGTNIFRPEDIRSNGYVPPVVLTQLTQGGEPLHIEPTTAGMQQVTLEWPYNYFEFEFAALSFSDPEKNQYAYRLDNFDQDWIANGAFTFGRYTNLPGGSYTLRIIGANNDGLWNQAGTSIMVTVVPPIWQTWWFRGIAVLLVGASVFAIYRLRVRSVENYNRHLQRQVDERTREIETLFEQTKALAIIEERNRLARDLHDSAKQKAFAALAQLGAVRSMITRDPNKAKSHLNEVEDLVYEVIQELTFLIQEMYPIALQEKGLTAVLFEYLYEWENRNNIRVHLSANHEQRLPLEIEQALYRITQESLANVARHSCANQMTIELSYSAETVEMVISDDGCGFNLDQKPAGVGLRTMQERAIMIGGSLKIETTPGGGTRIRVSVPIQKQESHPLGGSNGGSNGSPNNHSNRR